VFLLPHSEDRVILCPFVWIGYQRVTDGQTELLSVLQRSALRAMRPRCNKNCSPVSADKNKIKQTSLY